MFSWSQRRALGGLGLIFTSSMTVTCSVSKGFRSRVQPE
jgi:hypothetical protein